MQVIDQINGSALFAQSAYSASIATKDDLGRDITATYLTGVSIPESATWNEVSTTVQTNSATWGQGGGGSGDEEVNSFVYNNSASINDVNASYQANSGTFLTAVDLTPYQTIEGMTAYAEKTDLEDYAKSSALDAYQLSGNYLSANALDGYATEQWVGEQGYLTAVDLTPYQTTAGMTAYQPAGDYATTNDLEQVSGDITALIPSTAGLASESYVQTNSAVLTGMIDAKQDALTFGYDEQDRINSINNSALAGGGDVPEGTMVESNLEYNSQGYINGYNGSAVATIDQERQWFTHDDTLCHISNSAQYALGVNMSAISADLARMMGVDETVLLDRGTDDLTAPNTAQLSEPFSAFEKIEIWSVWNPWPTNVPQATYYPGTATNGSYMVWDNSQYMRAGYGKWAVNGTTFQLVSASQTTNWPTFDSPQTGLGGIRKIVGIGRRQ